MSHTAREGRPEQPARVEPPPPPPPFPPNYLGVAGALPSIFTQHQQCQGKSALSADRQKYALRLAEQKLSDLCLIKDLDEEKLRSAAYVLQQLSQACLQEADCMSRERKSGVLARLFRKIKSGLGEGIAQ